MWAGRRCPNLWQCKRERLSLQGSHLSLQNISGVDSATVGKADLVPTCYLLMLVAPVEDMFGLSGARVAWGALSAIGFGKPFKRAKAGAARNAFAPNGADLASKKLPVCRAAPFAFILAARFTKLLGKASAIPRWLQNWWLCQMRMLIYWRVVCRKPAIGFASGKLWQVLRSACVLCRNCPSQTVLFLVTGQTPRQLPEKPIWIWSTFSLSWFETRNVLLWREPVPSLFPQMTKVPSQQQKLNSQIDAALALIKRQWHWSKESKVFPKTTHCVSLRSLERCLLPSLLRWWLCLPRGCACTLSETVQILPCV